MINASTNFTSKFTCPHQTMMKQALLLQRSSAYDDFLLSFIIINCGISIFASLTNLAVIYTVSRTPSLRTPSNILIVGLAISDLGVGMITQPAFYLRGSFKLQKQFALFCAAAVVYDNTIWIFPAMSFLILTAIIFDRLLAVRLHLRYQQVITVSKYCIVLVFVMLADSILILFKLFVDVFAFFVLLFVFLVAFLLLNAIFVFKISRVIHRHSVQIQAQQQSVQQSIDMPRYKKSVNTMYYVIGAFVICYVPYVIGLGVLYMVDDWTLEINFLFTVTITLMMCNGVLNPIIYFWRIKEIRSVAFSRLFKQNNAL